MKHMAQTEWKKIGENGEQKSQICEAEEPAFQF